MAPSLVYLVWSEPCYLLPSTSCTLIGSFALECVQKTVKLHYFAITIPDKTNSDDNQSQKTFLQIFDIFIFQDICTHRLLWGGLWIPLNSDRIWKTIYTVLNLEEKEEFTWGYHLVSKTCWKFKFKMLGVQRTTPSIVPFPHPPFNCFLYDGNFGISWVY